MQILAIVSQSGNYAGDAFGSRISSETAVQREEFLSSTPSAA